MKWVRVLVLARAAPGEGAGWCGGETRLLGSGESGLVVLLGGRNGDCSSIEGLVWMEGNDVFWRKGQLLGFVGWFCWSGLWSGLDL